MWTTRAPTITLCLITLCLSSGACASTRTGAVRYDTHTAGVHDETRLQIDVENRVAQVCHLPRDTSYLSSDDARVSVADDETLARVAECMMTGNLMLTDVVIIGYGATPTRRAPQQNVGLARAEIVAAALARHGVPTSRLFIKSAASAEVDDVRTAEDRAADARVTLRIATPR